MGCRSATVSRSGGCCTAIGRTPSTSPGEPRLRVGTTATALFASVAAGVPQQTLRKFQSQRATSLSALEKGKARARCCIHWLSHRYGIPEQTLLDIDGKNPVQITGRTEYKRRHYSNSVIAGGGNREPAAHAKKIGILRVNSWSAFETGMLELAAASNPSVWAQPWYSGSDVAGQRLEEPPSSTSQENPEKISEIQERPY